MDQTTTQHKQATGQETEINPLPADTGQCATEQRLLQHLLNAMTAAQAGFETVERGGLADAVNTHLQFMDGGALRRVAAENSQQGILERQRGSPQFIRR
ncbi:hypothetical protein D3C78_1760940 [compost metagenome]